MSKSFTERNHIELIILGFLFLILTYNSNDIRELMPNGTLEIDYNSSIKNTLFYENTAIILTSTSVEFINCESNIFPKSVFSYSAETLNNFLDMQIKSDKLYILAEKSFIIIDIKKPSIPRIVSSIPISNYQKLSNYESGIILISDRFDMKLYQINESRLIDISNLRINSLEKAITRNNIMFSLSAHKNISIYNLSSQIPLTTLTSGDNFEDIFIRENYLYVIQEYKVMLYDFSDFQNIIWKANYSYQNMSEYYDSSMSKSGIFLGEQLGILTGTNGKGETHVFGIKFSEGMPKVFHHYYHAQAYSFTFGYLDNSKGFLIGSGVFRIIEISRTSMMFFRVIDYIIISVGIIAILKHFSKWNTKKISDEVKNSKN